MKKGAHRSSTPAPRRAIKWSGTDLTPMPFESLVSCLLRLAWRNCLAWNVLTGHFPKNSAQRFRGALQAIEEETGWRLPAPGWTSSTTANDVQALRWRAKLFRYCPVCLEHGYHSDLYQLTSLHLCPMHHVPLTTRCQSCGQATATYGYDAALFGRAYQCQCGGPVSGATPMIEAHMDFRDIASTVFNVLAPYQAWWADNEEGRNRSKAMYVPGVQALWCNVDEFLRACALLNASPLTYIVQPRYPKEDVIMLRWGCAIHHQSQEHRWVGSRWRERSATCESVYRATLRLLARSLKRRYGVYAIAGFDRFEVQQGKVAPAYPTDVLSFICLRWLVEQNCSPYYASIPDLPLDKVTVPVEPSVDMAQFGQRSARLAWRAMFLALYAMWYARLNQSPDPLGDLTQLHPPHAPWRAMIFSHSAVAFPHSDAGSTGTPESIARFEGHVALLRVPGMPLTPFSPVAPRRLEDRRGCG